MALRLFVLLALATALPLGFSIDDYDTVTREPKSSKNVADQEDPQQAPLGVVIAIVAVIAFLTIIVASLVIYLRKKGRELEAENYSQSLVTGGPEVVDEPIKET
jgi:hypothetical protein